MGYDPAYQEPAVSAGGPFPVLLLSGGWTPPAWYLTGVATRLASHGFVVAVPYHVGDPYYFGWEPVPDHWAMCMWNRPRDALVRADRSRAAEQRRAGPLDRRHRSLTRRGLPAGRPAAMLRSSWPAATTRSGIMPRPMAITFTDGPIPENVPHSPSLPDPRIKAIIILDGANQDLKFQELARVNVPALSLGQEWSTKQVPSPISPPGTPGSTPPFRAIPTTAWTSGERTITPSATPVTLMS